MLESRRSGGRPAFTRRAALGAAMLLAATGCDLDARSSPPSPSDAAPPTAAPSATPSATPEPVGTAAPDADLLLLDQTRSAIAAMLGVVVATRRAQPTLRRPLRGLQRMHQAHLDTLDTAGPTSSTSATGPPDDLDSAAEPTSPSATGNDVRSAVLSLERREARLQQQLVDASLTAASGEFARLLASMNASVAQHLTQLPRVR